MKFWFSHTIEFGGRKKRERWNLWFRAREKRERARRETAENKKSPRADNPGGTN